MKNTLAIAAVIAIAALGLWLRSDPVATGTARQPGKIPVTLYSAVSAPLFDHIEVVGTLLGRESIVITANATETVAELHFSEGQQVTKGELLASLSQREELAQLASAKADLAEQQREVKRLEGLIKTHAAAQTELDQRRTALNKARHKIEELQAILADLNLSAPFAGVVGFRQVSPGALVSPGTAITTLDDIEQLKLEFSVPETLLASLKLGQSIEAYSAALQQSFTGNIASIDSRVNPVNRSIRARALFDNPDHRLKPGMLMTATLQSRPRNAISVPEEALLSHGREHSLWVYDTDSGTVSQRKVDIGSRRPGWVEVRSGIEAGEQLVRTGISRLRAGSSVVVSDPAS